MKGPSTGLGDRVRSLEARKLPSRRELRRGTISSIAMGLGFGVLFYVVTGGSVGLTVFPYCTLVGLLIHGSLEVLGYWLDPWVDRLSPGVKKVAVGLSFFVGGNTGWFAATFIASRVGWVNAKVFESSAQIVVVNGLIAVPIGFAFYAISVLKKSLAASAAKLKDREWAERELEHARQLQQRMLPPPEASGPGYRVSARNLPAHGVAGDFFDVFPVGAGGLGLAIADVAGKGMPASLLMATAKARLPLLAAGRSAGEILRALNDLLSRELAPREFVALAYALFDPATGTVELANAGLPDPYLLRNGQAPRPITVPGPRFPLGLKLGRAYESARLEMEPGDRLLFLTDGPPEAPRGGEPLGYDAFVSLLPLDETDTSRFLDVLIARVRQATVETLEDDWTLLLLERPRT